VDECKPLAGGDLQPRRAARDHRALRQGRPVQVDPIKPTCKPPGTKRLKLNDDESLSNFAFNFKLRCYPKGTAQSDLRTREAAGKQRGPLPHYPPTHMQQPPQQSDRVMRTVFLPAANTESLILKIESLQAQLNEQRKFSNERIAALLEVRRCRLKL